MTKDRAMYILNNTVEYGGLRWSYPSPLNRPPYYSGSVRSSAVYEDGITPDEFNYVKMIWNLMPDSASFYNALQEIAKGM